MAAICHAAVCVGFAGFAPLVIWLMNKDGSPWLARHAKRAMVAQFVGLFAFVVITTVTCGLGAVLYMPWMAAELYLAYKVWEDDPVDYPLLPEL